MEFHEKLVALRRENHLTQSGLAAALGVTRQTVYKWETGQSYPEAMTLFAMRNLFNVPTDVLLDNTVTLTAYKESIAVDAATETAVCNAAPKAEPAPKAEAVAEPAAKDEAEETQEEVAEAKATEAAEPEKKKKGLFSRLFNR